MTEEAETFREIGRMAEAQEELTQRFEPEFKRLSQEYDRDTIVSALDGILFDLRNRNAFNTYDIDDEVFTRLIEIKYQQDIEFTVAGIEPETFAARCERGNPLICLANFDVQVPALEESWDEVKKLATEHGLIVVEAFFDMVVFPHDVEPELLKYSDTKYYPRDAYVEAVMDTMTIRFPELQYKA